MKRLHFVSFEGNPACVAAFIFVSLVFSVIFREACGQAGSDVITSGWLEYSDAPNSLYRYMTGKAYFLLNQRENKISELQSLADWQQRQAMIRETLAEIVGPFPEKTPLNAKITRTIDKGTYKVEHIIYESSPGFFVTSSLYIPAGRGRKAKAPVVIYCSGHSAEGYRNEVYQHVILNLVSKGFIVFAFDPVGQGERLEYLERESGNLLIDGPTKQHSYPGAQAFIAGSSQARYMIWDGIRAVDYVITRKEVDPLRIGITGRSGGGTQSAYIAAFDDRIYASAPENYITNYRRLLQSIGPQDAEQNIFNLIFRGLDHPDFLIVRAPKPALMITTTGDMFSIQGAMETEEEVSGIYKAYGKSEKFSRVVDDAGHASTLKNREAMYAFFQKHLENPGTSDDQEIKPLTPEELKVTETGQVSTSLGSETVFSLNRRLAQSLSDRLAGLRSNAESYISEIQGVAAKISGYIQPALNDNPVFTGRIRRNNYTIEKYFMNGEGDYIIPYLLFKPDFPGRGIMIYLHPSGKSVESVPGGEIERLVEHGITVLAPDLIGTGEMGPGILRGDADFKGASHNLWYAGILTGKTIVGIRSADVVKLAMQMKKEYQGAEIWGLARSDMSPVLLHAATFSSLIECVALFEPYSSYMSIVMNRFYNPEFILSTVPGALSSYDLPDLVAAIAPRKVFISDMTDGSGRMSDTSSINKEIDIIKAGFKYRNAESKLKITTGKDGKSALNNLMEWLK